MNINKKGLVFILIIIIVVPIIVVCINTRYNEKIDMEMYNQIYLLQTSSISNSKEIENKFQYYDQYGKLIKEEKFKDKGDISYNCYDSNYIYSFGPGGLYKTDCNAMETQKISEEDVNIVKFYNEEMYYFVNNGFLDEVYSSTICTPDSRIELDFFLLDFVKYDGKYYILGLDSLYICDGMGVVLKKIDISDFKFYQKILEIDSRIFLVNESSFYEIKDDKIVYFSTNDIIKDLNLKQHNNSESINFIVDDDLKKILKIELLEDSISISNFLDITSNFKTTYDFNLKNLIQYNVDYNSKKITINELKNNIISEFNINISKNESVFKVYKLK